MKSESHLAFLQKITRRLAETFSEINSLCLAQIANMKSSVQESDEVAEQEEELGVEAEAVAVAEVDEVVEQEKQADKEAKTKRIRKEEDVQNRLKKKGKKFSNKPKAPPSSFLIFFKQQQPNIAKSYPTYGVTELTKVAAQCWKDLSIEEKEPYIRQCDDERKIYQQRMIKYRIDFPEEIAERQKGKKQPRKDNKKGIKDTPRKEIGVVGEPEIIQQQLPQEQSQSLSEQNPDDSLGFL